MVLLIEFSSLHPSRFQVHFIKWTPQGALLTLSCALRSAHCMPVPTANFTPFLLSHWSWPFQCTQWITRTHSLFLTRFALSLPCPCPLFLFFFFLLSPDGSQVLLLEPDELAAELSMLSTLSTAPSPPTSGTSTPHATASMDGTTSSGSGSGSGGASAAAATTTAAALAAAAAARLSPLATVQAVLDHHHGGSSAFGAPAPFIGTFLLPSSALLFPQCRLECLGVGCSATNAFRCFTTLSHPGLPHPVAPTFPYPTLPYPNPPFPNPACPTHPSSPPGSYAQELEAAASRELIRLVKEELQGQQQGSGAPPQQQQPQQGEEDVGAQQRHNASSPAVSAR